MLCQQKVCFASKFAILHYAFQFERKQHASGGERGTGIVKVDGGKERGRSVKGRWRELKLKKEEEDM